MTGARETLAKRVRDFRKQRGLTQQALAEKTGLSVNMIGGIERGYKFPSPETLDRITKALGVQLEELFHASPVDNAKRVVRKAMEEIEMMLSDSSVEYIRMVGNILKELKRSQSEIKK